MKLSNALRDNIISNVIAVKTKGMVEKIKLQESEFAKLCVEKYIEHLGNPDFDYDAFGIQVDTVAIKDGYEHHEFIYRGKAIFAPFTRNMFRCANSAYSLRFYTNELSPELLSEYRACYELAKRLSNYKYDLKAELKNILYECSTIKQLLEVFPDVEEISGIKLTNTGTAIVKLDTAKLNLLLTAAI